jgi:hypothetical protein
MEGANFDRAEAVSERFPASSPERKIRPRNATGRQKTFSRLKPRQQYVSLETGPTLRHFPARRVQRLPR